MTTTDELIAKIRAIGDMANAMRKNAPIDDPLQAPAFRLAALCGKIEGQIHANALQAERAGLPLEEWVRRQDQQ